MTDQNAPELDEGTNVIDPSEPEPGPLPADLPDDVRTGVDEAAYNPTEDNPRQPITEDPE